MVPFLGDIRSFSGGDQLFKAVLSVGCLIYRIYPPLKLTAKAPENRQRAYFKEIHLNQPSIFRGKFAVTFREGV